MDSIKKAQVQSSTNNFVNQAEAAKVQTETNLKEINELKTAQKSALAAAEQNYTQTSNPNNINTTAEASTILVQAKAQLDAARVAFQNTESAIKTITDCKETAASEKAKIDDIRHGRNLGERQSHDKGVMITEAGNRSTSAMTAAATAKSTLASAKQAFDAPIAQMYVLLDQVTTLQRAEDARRLKEIADAQALQAQTAQLSIQPQQPLENKEVDEQIKLILDSVAISQQTATAPLDQDQQIGAILDAMKDLNLNQAKDKGKQITLVVKTLEAIQSQQHGQVPSLSDDERNGLAVKIHIKLLSKDARRTLGENLGQGFEQPTLGGSSGAAILNMQNLHMKQSGSGLTSSSNEDNDDDYIAVNTSSTGRPKSPAMQ